MASLQNEQIDLSYQGLIKTTDNAALPVNGKAVITDGEGNPSVLELGQQEAGITNATLYSGAATIGSDPINDQFVYGGTQDFSGATVIGVGGAAGLVAGTGVDSMKSADSLTTTAASAAGAQSIAIGNGASAALVGGVSIGDVAVGGSGVTIGDGAGTPTFTKAIAIGNGAATSTQDSIAIGTLAYVSATNAIAIGKDANAYGTAAVALGQGVNADKANTVSMKALDLQTASTPTVGGIIMTDAGSVERRLNITATGTLQIDSTPVGGGGGAAGLESGAGTNSMKSAATLTTTAATAAGADAIVLGNGASSISARTVVFGVGSGNTSFADESVSIGNNAQATGYYGIAIGPSSTAKQDAISMGRQAGKGTGASVPGERSVNLGHFTAATGLESVAIGSQSTASATGAVALGADVIADTANTTTVNLFQIAGYATMDYADDTAAATGGIPLGGVYHTSGALKIRIA